MDRLAGFIKKRGIDYAVIGRDGVEIKIDHIRFPSVKKLGVVQVALEVSHYVALGKFLDNTDETLKKEIKRAIGDKG